MPDRAIIPLVTAAMGGFICGLVAAALQLTGAAAFAVGFAGAIICVGAGSASAVKAPGVHEDRFIVGALRAALAAALFSFIYVALLAFLRDGSILLALVFLVIGGLFAGLLTEIRVRNPPDRSVTQ